MRRSGQNCRRGESYFPQPRTCAQATSLANTLALTHHADGELEGVHQAQGQGHDMGAQEDLLAQGRQEEEASLSDW